MKKHSLALFFLMAFLSMAQAQKYACVNTDYIMRQVPEYSQALGKINKFIGEWKGEIEAKKQEVDELRESYQQETYLLPDNLKQRRQDEIRNKEAELRALQHQRFSAGGDLDQKRAELIKPVQDRVYNAIERISREKNFAFVFDKAASATVLYVGEKYDISNQVLEMMGIKPSSTPNAENAAPASMGKSGNNRGEARDNSRKDVR